MIEHAEVGRRLSLALWWLPRVVFFGHQDLAGVTVARPTNLSVKERHCTEEPMDGLWKLSPGGVPTSVRRCNRRMSA